MARLDQPHMEALVNCLARLPNNQSREGRDHLLFVLPEGLRNKLPRHSATSTDLFNIVNGADNWGADALDNLIEQALTDAAGSDSERELRGVQEWLAQLPARQTASGNGTPSAARQPRRRLFLLGSGLLVLIAGIGLAMLMPSFLNPLTSSTKHPTATVPLANSPDWHTIIRVTGPEKNDPCLTGLVLPPDIQPETNLDQALEEVQRRIQDSGEPSWPKAPLPNGNFVFYLNIASIVDGQDWIQLANKAKLTFRTQKEAPEHLRMVKGCEGAGSLREFPLQTLDSQFKTYQADAVAPDADFYTLQPGEFEAFELPFKCAAIGTYAVHMEMPYTYAGQDGLIQLDLPELTCPQSFTHWDPFALPSHALTNYTWKGSEYAP